MEVLNLNDYIRSNLLDYIESMRLKGLSHEEAIEEYRNLLYDLENDLEKKNEREYIIKIIYLDAIKMTMYTHKTGIVDDDEATFLCDLKSLDNFDEILAEVSSNIDLFFKMIKYAYKYAEIDSLSKKLICKSLSPIENDWLNNIICFHMYDILEASSKISVEDIVNELKRNKEYQEKHLGQDLSDSNVLRMMGVLQSLRVYDSENLNQLLLDIAKVDYAVCKYLSKRVDDCPLVDDHLDFYENYPLNDILYFLSTNQMILKSSIWMLVSLYIDECFDEIPLPQNILENELNEQIIKKLTLN